MEDTDDLCPCGAPATHIISDEDGPMCEGCAHMIDNRRRDFWGED